MMANLDEARSDLQLGSSWVRRRIGAPAAASDDAAPAFQAAEHVLDPVALTIEHLSYARPLRRLVEEVQGVIPLSITAARSQLLS